MDNPNKDGSALAQKHYQAADLQPVVNHADVFTP